MKKELLETKGLSKDYGGLVAIDDVNISFFDDEVCAIIGPNGAGKTTFFNLLTGGIIPTNGNIFYKDEDITSFSSRKVAERGLLRSYQTANLFRGLTVLENVRVATQSNHSKYNFWRDINDYAEIVEKAEETIKRVHLQGVEDKKISELSHGEQRTLEIAVTLGADPDLLLMDEPTSGVSPEDTSQITDIIEDVSDDIPVVVVEHKMSVVKRIADRIIVLHNGKKLSDGTPEEIRNDKKVEEVYLQKETI